MCHNEEATASSPLRASLPPCSKLIIQMAKMISPRARCLHVDDHRPPAARRLGSPRLVSAGGEGRGWYGGSTTRPALFPFSRIRGLQNGEFGVAKSTQQGFHRVLIGHGRCQSCRCTFGPRSRDRPSLSAPRLTCREPVGSRIRCMLRGKKQNCDQAKIKHFVMMLSFGCSEVILLSPLQEI